MSNDAYYNQGVDMLNMLGDMEVERLEAEAKKLKAFNPLPQLSAGLSKHEIAIKAADSVSELLDSGRPVFEVVETLAVINEFTDRYRDNQAFIDAVRDEVIKHGGKYTTASGALIEVTESGVKYDYSHDAEWQTIDQQIKALQEQKKGREAVLKSAAPGREKVCEETGEMITGALKTSKSTYKITLKKI